MKSIYFLVLIMLFSLDCHSMPGSVNLTVVEKQDGFFRFDISSSNEYEINNVVLQYEGLGKRWLLQFKAKSGLEVASSNSKADSITVDEFLEALNILILYIGKNEDIGLDEIQMDLRLIDSTWNAVVLAVKNAASFNIGLVMHKDKSTGGALLNTLQKSKLIVNVCKQLVEYSYKCSSNPVGINPIAFQNFYLRKQWKTISNSTDAGIYESASFSIVLH